MCIATGAALASGVMGLAGAGVSAYGSMAGGEASRNAAYYNAQVAENNARINEQKAEYASAAGQVQAGNTSLKGAARGAKIKTGQAASGVDVNSGSAVDVQASERELGKLDTETVLNNAELQAYGYRTGAVSDRAQAQLDRMGGDNARTAGEIGAVGSLLSGASSVGFRWGGGSGSGSRASAAGNDGSSNGPM